MKKRISVLIPTYNEEENVVPLSEAIVAEFQKSLPQYEYEIVFIDNDSTDTTRDKIRMICKKDPQIKAIFNAKNFGQWFDADYGRMRNPYVCGFPGSD